MMMLFSQELAGTVVMVICCLCALVQLGFFLCVFLQLAFLGTGEKKGRQVPVSVIICARNELKNLR